MSTLQLYPVIRRLEDAAPDTTSRDRVEQQRREARAAVRRSAEASGVRIDELRKSSDDVPQPDGDVWWSLSHCKTHVAGTVAPCPVGIDIESPRAVRDAARDRVLRPDEALLFQEHDPQQAFLIAWTAKEAVLKCTGDGLSGLSRCNIVATGGRGSVVEYDAREFTVHQFFAGGCVAAVCVLPPGPEDVEVSLDWIGDEDDTDAR